MNGDVTAPTVRELFDAVCDLPPTSWRPRLAALCGDAETVENVLALLDAQTVALERAVAPLGQLIASLPAAELRVGDRLGVWRLSEQLGTGGMGTVFVAERDDHLYRQRVAIKLLRGVPGPEARERLAAERQILADLQHPNIARLFDGGTTPAGHPYLVMEYVQGLPLDRWCARNAPDLRERLRLFVRICQAVQAAHARLVVHCDLKPSNILVREDGEPVLLDFGIARLQGDADPASGYGTPGYASPEQLAGARPGLASDVFSLGILLIELAVGLPLQRSLASRTTPPPAPSAHAADPARARVLRGDIDAICRRACALDPAARYATVDALRDDVQRHLDLRPVAARGGGALYRWGLHARRNRWQIVAAGVTGTAVVVGLLVSLHALGESRRHQAALELRQAELERVTAFQRAMLEDIDLEGMGADLLAEVRAQLPVQGTEAGQGDPLARLEPVDIARRLIDRQILARADGAIAGGFGDSPQLAADLEEALAQVQLALGLYPEAATRYARIARQRETLGAGDEAILRARTGEATAWNQSGGPNPGVAREVLEAALAASALPRTHRQHILARLQLATALLHTGEPVQAVEMAEGARRDAEAHLDGDDETVLAALSTHGAMLMRTGDLLAARGIIGDLLERHTRRDGPEDPRTLDALSSLALLHAMGKDFDQALALQTRLVEVQRRRLGAEHPLSLVAQGNLANFLLELDRNEEAHGALLEVHEARVRVLGAEAPLTLRAKLNLATYYARNEDVARALQLEAEVLESRRRILGPEHPDTLSVLINHAATTYRAARLGDAQRLFDEALPVARRVLGDGHPQYQMGLFVQGLVALDRNDSALAIGSYRELLGLRLRDQGPSAVFTLESVRALRDALRTAGRDDEAGQLEARYVAPFLELPEAGLSEAQKNMRALLLEDRATAEAPASAARG
ncbi:protein kinase domain-containing protein [Coralloluteibacterium thermophilus]|uniref:Tetratricopeptide repeat protein n=1 Tax=Coralloluteibacterium thermophilum TaxID=2707049 RepID=A0ABV9NMS9_9GAMM